MYYLKLLFMIFSVSTFYAQYSFNCELLSKTDIVDAYGIDVKDNYLFVTSDKFSILDISDIYNVEIIYSDSLAWNIPAVSVRDNYAYLASSNGLIIVDITSYSSPKVISDLDTLKDIEDIILHNDIAFLGKRRSSYKDPGIVVVDVSEPRNPRVIASIDEGIDDVWGLDFQDNILFAASEDTGVKIIDVSNPANPIELSSFVPQSNSRSIIDVAVEGDVVIAAGSSVLYAIDISDLENPKLLDTLVNVGDRGWYDALYIENNFLYSLAAASKLYVIDISNPTDLKIAGYHSLYSYGNDLYVKDKLVYVPGGPFDFYFVKFDNTTDVEEDSYSLNDYSLSQNYPNPFNPTTKISYSIPRDDFVQLKIYDILGNEVATLVNKEQIKGRYEIEFNAKTLSSSVYFYRLISGDYIDTKKLILLR